MKATLLSTEAFESRYSVTVETDEIIDFVLSNENWIELYVKAQGAETHTSKDKDDILITSIQPTSVIENNKIVLKFSLPDLCITDDQLKELFDYYIHEAQEDYDPVEITKYDFDNLCATFIGTVDSSDYD